MLKYCKCGCGMILPNTNKGQRFINHHNNRGIHLSLEIRKKISNSNKGKIFTSEHKKKLSEAHKGCLHPDWRKRNQSIRMTGRKLSEETKTKISNAHKGKRMSKEAKRKMSIAKQNMSAETKRKIGEVQKGRVFSDEHKRKLSDIRLKGIASGRIKLSWKYFNTSIELAIESELNKNKINYIKQYPINGVGIVDFFLSDFNLIVECDGKYWHNKKDRPQKDINRDLMALFKYGYKTIRFTDEKINKSPKRCINEIIKERINR